MIRSDAELYSVSNPIKTEEYFYQPISESDELQFEEKKTIDATDDGVNHVTIVKALDGVKDVT